MRNGILYRKASLYSTSRLVEAGEERNHDMRVINYLRCYMDISHPGPSVVYHDLVADRHAVEETLEFDAVVPRIGASYTFYGTALVRQFEMMGVFAANDSQGITRSRDKLRAQQLLSRSGVDLPATTFAHDARHSKGLIDRVGGTPVIVKLLEGTQGVGVVLAETRKAAESVIGAFRQLDANILVQEFIKEAGGDDLRAIVIGGKVVAAMERHAAPGEFRANLHRGGSAEAATLTPKERKTAVLAAKSLGLNVAGVDMLRSKRGPLVLEVNSSPGLEGVEKATGVDVAGKIIEYIENTAPRGNRKDRVGA
ncbi:MAG: 30S ribosomal protein S6--L-glutamate ligase [Gemmatimonadales bacterium]|nr:MAG: 30S ribosomal protein S6--L-glutamate ligase [Gemmatimonadales bacterium]